jgi:hypothetical protein
LLGHGPKADGPMLLGGNQSLFAGKVVFNEILIVPGERKRIQYLRGSELRVAPQQRANRRASAVPSPQPSDENAGTGDVGASAELCRVAFDVWMGHPDRGA